MKNRLLGLFGLAAATMAILAGCTGSDSTSSASSTTGGDKPAGDKVKVGFIVKSMADSWFKYETQFAKEQADKLGIELDVQEAKTGDAVLSTMDTMASNGVKGVIICAPEVQLGTSIQAAAKKNDLKLMSVDDRLVGADGKPLADIPHLGISAKNIGKMVGDAISAEMAKRGWKPEEVGAIAVLKEGLATAEERVGGAKEALVAAGFKADKIFIAPWMGAVDLAAASEAANPVLTRNGTIKKWVCFSSNDDGTIGAVRAMESAGITAENIIGVGINGPLAADDFKKDKPTGVFGSVMLQPSVHGGKTVEMMAEWIKSGKEPEKETYTSGVLITRENYKEAMKKEGLAE